MKTFKPGTFYFYRTSSFSVWFYPTEDLKNGGLKGLMSCMKDSGKYPKPVYKTVDKVWRNDFREELPPAPVLKSFERHDDWKAP